MASTDFDQLSATFTNAGPEGLLTAIAEQLRSEQKYHELFDVLLMHARHRLGLPTILMSGIEELPEGIRGQLEAAYLNVCREVGGLLLTEKRIREAWPYLRPVGDRKMVAEALSAIESDDDNVPMLIEILLHEGVDVARGYQLVLDQYGTCNAITTFEGIVLAKPAADQRAAAEQLVRRLHEELVSNVRFDIERQKGTAPVETRLIDLIAANDGLLEGNRYHIDTTHLAAGVRYARLLEDREAIGIAHELAEYGRQLSPQFQTEGEEPFVDFYAAHALFFAAQLGKQTKDEEAISYFRERAEQVDATEHGPAAAETLVALLSRLGRYGDAIDAAIKLVPSGTQTSGFAPTVMELSNRLGDYRQLMEVCQSRGDAIGYAAALIEQEKLKS